MIEIHVTRRSQRALKAFRSKPGHLKANECSHLLENLSPLFKHLETEIPSRGKKLSGPFYTLNLSAFAIDSLGVYTGQLFHRTGRVPCYMPSSLYHCRKK
jgi:hypothetical protein